MMPSSVKKILTFVPQFPVLPQPLVLYWYKYEHPRQLISTDIPVDFYKIISGQKCRDWRTGIFSFLNTNDHLVKCAVDGKKHWWYEFSVNFYLLEHFLFHYKTHFQFPDTARLIGKYKRETSVKNIECNFLHPLGSISGSVIILHCWI